MWKGRYSALLSWSPDCPRGTCNKSHHVCARALVRVFLERKREWERGRERENQKRRRRWKGMTTRERERNVQQCQQFGRCKRASIRDAALRFVYFSWKALRQHVAAAACEWHVCIQRCAFSSFALRSSLRRWSLIHGGWSPATRVCTREQKKAWHLAATMAR